MKFNFINPGGEKNEDELAKIFLEYILSIKYRVEY